jgi:hypothetical protein
MGLTLEAERRLEKAGLVALFENGRATWLDVAQKAYTFVRDGFPQGAMIRRDDVQKALIRRPVLRLLD